MQKQYLKVANTKDFEQKKYKTFQYLSRTIAIIQNDDGSYYAIEGNCKHQNANLFTKAPRGEIVVCPRHGWKFNIKTGECLTESWACLRKFPLKIEGNDIYLLPTPQYEEASDEQ